MRKVIYITSEGLKKLQDELEQLRTVERPAISQLIAEARDKGDLSENAEYDAAKEAQGMLEMKIAKLENTIANARIIDESKIDTDRVQILTRVKIRNTQSNAVSYTHLRAHETVLDLVCRLLLEKKKKNKTEKHKKNIKSNEQKTRDREH